MRRKDREITDRKVIDEILAEAQHGHLGMCDGDVPYVVPMNFAWCSDDGVVFLHCAKEGRKLDIIAKNSNVCFQVDSRTKVLEAENACGWGMLYACVIIEGKAALVQDVERKEFALESLMRHFKPDFNQKFTREEIDSVAIIEIKAEKISAKARSV